MAEQQDKQAQQADEAGRKISRRKFLAICAGAVVLAGGGLAWSGSRVARETVGKAAGVTTGDGQAEYLRQIVAQDNAHGRTIMWQSPERMQDARIEYREGEGEPQTVPATEEAFTDDSLTVYLYTAELAGLAAGTKYEYRIYADGQANAWHALATDDGQSFEALIFPDSQSSDYSGWKRLAQEAAKRNASAAFFINMGDLVDNGEDHTQWNAWLGAVGGIIDRIPVAPIMGNHETYNEAWQVREPVAYLREFATPANGNAEFDRRYYSFDYGPVHFIVLDTQQDEAADFHQGLVEAEQAWFREDAQKTGKPWKIVLMHKDPLQYRIHNRPERTEGFSKEGELWMPLFDAAGIDVVFSAHLHTYRNRGHIKNFARDASGPLYILTGVAGDVRYPGLWIDHALDQTVAPQPETDNYLTLAAAPNRLDIHCFLPDGTEIDHESVRK